jgi:hypothetical protein
VPLYIAQQDEISSFVLFLLIQSLKIQELQQRTLALHRDIAHMMKLLGDKPEAAHKMVLGNSVPLFPAKKGSHMHLGDTAMLGNV